MEFCNEEVVMECPALPHEFSNKPRSIKYYVKGPDNGLNGNTGCMLVIHGQAEHPNMRYYRTIRNEWANKYNVLAIGVEYLGTKLLSNPSALNKVQLEKLLQEVKKHYTIEELKAAVIDGKFEFTRLPPKALFDHICIKGDLMDEPLDFGYIQTIDCLTALGALLKYARKNRLSYNPRRIYAYGASMGAHIAQMCGKMAPATLAVIGDMSGFAFIPRAMITGGLVRLSIGKVRITVDFGSHYSSSASDENYYTDDMLELRNIGQHEHLRIAKQKGPERVILIFQGIDDKIVPAAGKAWVQYHMLLNGVHSKMYLFHKEDIDGDVILNTDHAIGNRQKIFEKFADKYLKEDSHFMVTTSYPNDFEAKSIINYPTNNGSYLINYNNKYPEIIFKTKI